MNKFVVRFEQVDDVKLPEYWYSGKSFVFDNLLDAVDHFKREFKFVRTIEIPFCSTIDGQKIVLTEHNGHKIYPTCFWAKMPNA